MAQTVERVETLTRRLFRDRRSDFIDADSDTAQRRQRIMTQLSIRHSNKPTSRGIFMHSHDIFAAFANRTGREMGKLLECEVRSCGEWAWAIGRLQL